MGQETIHFHGLLLFVTNLYNDLASFRNSFQVGVDSIVSALTAKGSTPADNSVSNIVKSINTLYSVSDYNASYNSGYDKGYNDGVKIATAEFPISFNCEGQNENNTGRVIWTYSKDGASLQMVKVTNFTLFYGSWTSVAMNNNYYYIQGSNNNSSWSNIYSKQISTAANYGDSYGCQNATVTLNSASFKYFRIVVSTTKKMDYRASGTFTFKNVV